MFDSLITYLVFGHAALICIPFKNTTTDQFNSTEYSNFRIQTVDGTSLGAWIIFAENHTSVGDNADIPTIIYVHGQKKDRADTPRLELYKVLRRKYHVLTFDYRGFGDSSCTKPTEDGVVQDTISVLKWAKSNLKSSKLFLWGHSLGTGIIVEALAKMNESTFTHLILESPFNNFAEAIRGYKFMKYFSKFKFMDFLITDNILKYGVTFRSDYYMSLLNCSILILHSKDDETVPFHLGKKLFDQYNDTKNILMVEFKEEHSYGHVKISSYPNLVELVT